MHPELVGRLQGQDAYLSSPADILLPQSPFRLAAIPALSAHVCSAETAVTKFFFASWRLPLFADDSRAPMPCDDGQHDEYASCDIANAASAQAS